jgi:two-component system, chemotaxis family, chemotaxis protein CheY
MNNFRLFRFGSSEETTPALPPGAAGQRTPSSTDGTQTTLHRKRVLIVDDDPVFLKATAMKLQSIGFQVSTAKEGSEAIAALREQPADAVLMDINFQPDVSNGGMQSWDGIQLMNWLRGLPGTERTRFYVVSSSDPVSVRQHTKQLGGAAYFQKPLDHDRLCEALNAGT